MGCGTSDAKDGARVDRARKAHPVLERGIGFVEHLDDKVMVYTHF